MKKTYYVNIGTGEISQNHVENNNSYTIQATDSDIRRLRAAFSTMHDASMDSFWRAHIPFVPYHHDQGNDRYDSHMVKVFEILYECGNDAARAHIESLHILDHNRLNE